MLSPFFKNLLVGLVRDPALPSPALDYALDLAAISGAHVTVEVDATDDTPVGAMNYEAASAVASVNERFVYAAEQAAERVRMITRATGLPCTVRTMAQPYATLVRQFAFEARGFDLAILDAAPAEDAPGGYVEPVVFESGRPVMVIPARTEAFRRGRAVIAWDGGREAARAVNEALPILHLMDQVEVVCVRPEADLQDRFPGLGIELHLRRHGIDATLLGLPLLDNDVSTLVGHVAATGADMVVMGAYSHTRAREWLLGGMTRSLLAAPPTALFLSH